MFFSKSYNTQNIIEGAIFFEKIDDFFDEYVSRERLMELSSDPKYIEKNKTLSGMYYLGISEIFSGKESELHDYLFDVLTYHYKQMDKTSIKMIWKNYMNYIKGKDEFFYEGYKEAKKYKGKTIKLIENTVKNYEK